MPQARDGQWFGSTTVGTMPLVHRDVLVGSLVNGGPVQPEERSVSPRPATRPMRSISGGVHLADSSPGVGVRDVAHGGENVGFRELNSRVVSAHTSVGSRECVQSGGILADDVRRDDSVLGEFYPEEHLAKFIRAQPASVKLADGGVGVRY